MAETEADQSLRDHRPIFGLIVLQVGMHRALPVDLAQAWSPIAERSAECTVHGLAEWLCESTLDILDNLADDLACSLSRARRDHTGERQQCGDQVNVWFYGAEQLRFEQELLQAESFHRVAPLRS